MCKQLAGIPEHWPFFFFSFPPSMKIKAANFCSEWLAGVCVCVCLYIGITSSVTNLLIHCLASYKHTQGVCASAPELHPIPGNQVKMQRRKKRKRERCENGK